MYLPLDNIPLCLVLIRKQLPGILMRLSIVICRLNANAYRGWYMNSFDGKVKYEDFFIKEFIPAVEKIYRIKSKKTYRGIAGLSMGGYGSLLYSLKYPQLFAAAAPLSAGVYDDDEITAMTDSDWTRVYGQVFDTTLKGKDRLNKAWYDNSILQLVKAKQADDLAGVRYWIDCGDDDFLTKGNCLLHLVLTGKKVRHEFRVRDGAHTGHIGVLGLRRP
jgi:S-formylglutathione hydrolase FrmB